MKKVCFAAKLYQFYNFFYCFIGGDLSFTMHLCSPCHIHAILLQTRSLRVFLLPKVLYLSAVLHVEFMTALSPFISVKSHVWERSFGVHLLLFPAYSITLQCLFSFSTMHLVLLLLHYVMVNHVHICGLSELNTFHPISAVSEFLSSYFTLGTLGASFYHGLHCISKLTYIQHFLILLNTPISSPGRTTAVQCNLTAIHTYMQVHWYLVLQFFPPSPMSLSSCNTSCTVHD